MLNLTGRSPVFPIYFFSPVQQLMLNLTGRSPVFPIFLSPVQQLMWNLTGTSVDLLRVFASATNDVKSNRHLYCPLCLFARVTTAVVSWPSVFTRWILCWWRSLTISCTEPASTVVCWTCRLWKGSWDLGQYRHYPEPDVSTVTTLNLMCVAALPWTWCV